MLNHKKDDFTLSICYRIGLCLLGCLAILLLFLPYAEAAPPPGGVSPTPPSGDVNPTPPPAVTSTLLTLSATKEAVAPSDSGVDIAEMPTALPAPSAAVPVPADNVIVSSPLDVDVTIMASDETSDAVAANQQDDEWRANAAAQGLSFCSRSTVSDSDLTSAGINQMVFAEGVAAPSVSYALHEVKEGVISLPITEEEGSQGIIQNTSFMKGTAPIPQELLDLGESAAAAFEEQAGSNDAANALLFTFSPPGVQAFGAWFGGLSSRSPLEGVGIDGDARGGKLAYMRLFDAEGRQIGPDRAIRPAQKEGEALCLDANGHSIQCETAHTRWVGFVTSHPIAQMLLVVGDHDDSDQLPACRVAADGGTEADFIAQCQAGDEHLSFVGPTICTNTPLDSIATDNINNTNTTPNNNHNTNTNTNNNSSTNTPLLLQPIRDNPLQSLALTGAGIALIGLLGFLWYKRR